MRPKILQAIETSATIMKLPHPDKSDFGEPTASGTSVVGLKMEQEPREPVVTASNAIHDNHGFPSPGSRPSVCAEASPGQAAVAGCHPLTSFGVRVIFFRLAGVPRLCRSTACLAAGARFTGLKSGGHSPAGLMLHIPIFLNLWDTCGATRNLCKFVLTIKGF